MTVRLHIERLIVEGVGVAELPLLRETLARELGRQLAAEGATFAALGSRDAVLRRAQQPVPEAAINGVTLGNATAVALHQELVRWDG
ncbi:hypothetical protein E5A73_16305 [Sphingomonas gei]|uniref:Uncharacterized protein n=1 Tax=Sphingomonas gei TaxID=1395960 RepID=A0A4S1X9F0_9SPHN|nr:hypothetical protein [Sphingomonas gei]TGX52355.1 hypothetical protein E5A73_16305 [Sphingomonas gei]